MAQAKCVGRRPNDEAALPVRGHTSAVRRWVHVGAASGIGGSTLTLTLTLALTLTQVHI